MENGPKSNSINRKDFLKQLSALGVVAFLPSTKKRDVDLESEENTVLLKMKIEGKIYALGYRLTGTPNDYRALTWLAYAGEMRIRDIRDDIPDKSFSSRPHRSLNLPEINENKT